MQPRFGPKTGSEFGDAAKQKPGSLNDGSAGIVSPQHLQSVLFAQRTGISGNHVPYKGQSQAMTDLVGGQLQYMFSPLQNALPFIREGRIRALGVALSLIQILRCPRIERCKSRWSPWHHSSRQ